MDNELKPSTQLSSRQKRNIFIQRLAFGCMVLPGLLGVLCGIFTVELPPAIQSISLVISGFGMILLLFWFSRPRQEWGIPAMSKSKARNRWRLLISMMVLMYVVLHGLMVFFLIQKQVPLSKILIMECGAALITIPLFAIMLYILRKMLDKFSE